MGSDRDRQSRFARVTGNAVAIFFGTMMAVLLAEIALRLLPPFELRIRGSEIVLPVNKTYVWKNSRIPALDSLIVHHKNSLGFRGPEPPADLDSRLSLLTIGGSTTECTYLSEGQTWPDRLTEHLRAFFPRLWLNNAGLDGHTTFGHIRLMQQHVAGLRPKIALFLVGINDVARESLSGDERFTFQGEPGAAGRRPGLRAFYVWLQAHLRLVAYFENIRRHWRAGMYRIRHGQGRPETAGTLAISPARRQQRLAWHRQHFLPAYRQRLQTLIALCRAQDIWPVFLTQPLLTGIPGETAASRRLARMRINDTLDGELYWQVLQLYNQTTRDVCAETGVRVIDLARELPKDPALFYDVCHFTPVGADSVAAIVARGLIPALRQQFPAFYSGEDR